MPPTIRPSHQKVETEALLSTMTLVHAVQLKVSQSLTHSIVIVLAQSEELQKSLILPQSELESLPLDLHSSVLSSCSATNHHPLYYKLILVEKAGSSYFLDFDNPSITKGHLRQELVTYKQMFRFSFFLFFFFINSSRVLILMSHFRRTSCRLRLKKKSF